jgi:AAA+ ATPase superfamily predicted ATPase
MNSNKFCIKAQYINNRTYKIIFVNRFINRDVEIDFLEKKYKSQGSQFIVLYGRRRVGKTELIKQFCKDKNSIYLLADKRGTLLNLETFAEKAADHFGDVTPLVENFYDLSKYLVRQIADEKYIIVIDEFSYLIERDDTIPSVFQVIWDEYLISKDIMLILCGSSVSMMVECTLTQKSPLYGRRTGQWMLEPLKAYHVPRFHEQIDVKKSIEFYSILGGVPLYILEFEPEKSVFKNIDEHILAKGEFLHEEVETLLKGELKEYYLYISIFEAIAKGRTRLVEISDYSKIQQKDLPKYVGTLMKLELIGKEYPVTEKIRSKKTRYYIKDNFFRFYFRYVHPNRTEIESGNADKVLKSIEKDFHMFVGAEFENIVKDQFKSRGVGVKLPFSFNRIGRQWGKIKGAPKGQNTYEIDIVAVNDDTGDIAFIECKWKNLSERDALDIFKDLKSKSGFVLWNNEVQMKYCCLVAKKVDGKDTLRKKGFMVFDLDDFDVG